MQILRAAFDATLKDAEFWPRSKRHKLEFDPMPGAELQALVETSTRVSGPVLERARAARGG